jgi:hypothetical protein
MDEAEFALWRSNVAKVEEMLAVLQQAQRDILVEMGWPLKPIAILDALEGKAPSPARFGQSDKNRARIAMFALQYVETARHHLGPASQNAPAAAHAAMMATALAGDIVANRIRKAVLRQGPTEAAYLSHVRRPPR